MYVCMQMLLKALINNYKKQILIVYFLKSYEYPRMLILSTLRNLMSRGVLDSLLLLCLIYDLGSYICKRIN